MRWLLEPSGVSAAVESPSAVGVAVVVVEEFVDAGIVPSAVVGEVLADAFVAGPRLTLGH